MNTAKTQINRNQKTHGAILYTRVSTGEQVREGTSLESQQDICRAKAGALSLPIIAEYQDAGISGAYLLLRPGMQAALADIQAGRADTLICANLSRYSRDTEHQQAIKKQVKAAGGKIVFCDMDFDDTPEGDLAFGIMGNFAEYERKVFRQRSMTGRKKMASNGQQPSRSLPPYGYHIPTKADVIRGDYPSDLLGRYIILAQQAAIARRIYLDFAGGSSMHAICKALNQEGVPTARGAAAWRPSSLKVILANPVYKGVAAFGKMKKRRDEGRRQQINPLTGIPYKSVTDEIPRDPSEWVTMPAPALVSEEIWDEVQERRRENKARLGGNPQRIRMLAGHVHCPECGGGMRYIVAREYKYYQCYAHMEARDSGTMSPCSQAVYSVPVTEAAVITALLDAVQNTASVQAQLQTYRKPADGAGEGSETALRQEMASLDKALDGLSQQEAAAVQAQIAGIMAGASPDAYAEAFAAIAARRKDMEGRRGTLKASLLRMGSRTDGPHTTLSPTDIDLRDNDLREKALADLLEVLSAEDVPSVVKRNILVIVIDKVICKKDGAVIQFLPEAIPVTEGASTETQTVHPTSKPQPRKAMVRPDASNAPRCASVSTPRAPPETTVSA